MAHNSILASYENFSGDIETKKLEKFLNFEVFVAGRKRSKKFMGCGVKLG